MSNPGCDEEEIVFLEQPQKTRIKQTHGCLHGLQICGTLTLQIMVVSILLSFILWLFLRIPEPEVKVTSFAVDKINGTNTTDTTLLHYSVSIHNPDIYKSVFYDALVMRITCPEYVSELGITVDFGKGMHQGRGETAVLGNTSADYTAEGARWNPEDMSKLRIYKQYIYLQFVMQLRVLGVTRQRMRTAEVYFDDAGNAFISRHVGLHLK